MPLNPALAEITARIVARSKDTRAHYLQGIERARGSGPARGKLSCANWAHAFAGSPAEDKARALSQAPNIGIV
ncbi:MAG: phosphogluconate dehydratase, partial [Caulobacteraceae bacterium]